MKTLLTIFILGLLLSACQLSGHKSQTWQPRQSNKGGQQYRR